jgi:hypothetical protein
MAYKFYSPIILFGKSGIKIILKIFLLKRAWFYPPRPGLETLPPELLPPDEDPLLLGVLLGVLLLFEGEYVLVLLFVEDELVLFVLVELLLG